MKILMVSTILPPKFGGAAIQATYLAKQLINQGMDVEFITDNCNESSKHDLYQGMPVFRCRTFSENHNSKVGEFIFALRTLFYVLTNRNIKIVHFHSARGLELLTFPLLKLMQKKVILKLTLMGTDDPLSFKNRKKIGFLYFWGLKFVDKFVAISTGLKEQAQEAGIASDKVDIIYNGVDTNRFTQLSVADKTALKKELQLNNHMSVFVSIGMIEHRKGYDFLLKAWLEIQGKFESPVLICIGPNNEETNPYYLSLEKFIKENKIDNVKFVGRISKVERYIQIADCFVFCSRAEGFGTVLIEAMSSGVPAAATNILGVTEDIIKNDNIGVICYLEDAEKFSRKVEKLVKDVNQQERQKAIAEVKQRFNVASIGQEYQNLYHNLMN